MFRKLAKILLGTMVGFILFTVCYIGYYYFEGYMISRTILNNISYYAMSENCLASDKVYSEDSTLTSVQDKIIKILDEYSEQTWYLDINTKGDVFGNGEDNIVSCWYLGDTGEEMPAFSYEEAAPKETLLTLRLRCNLSFPLKLVPNGGKEDYVLELPLTVTNSVVGTKYYKGTEDTFKN